MRLRDLVHPTPVDQFLQEIYGRTARLFPGDEHRFDGLVSWETLNALASWSNFAASQLRVSRDGGLVPRAAYMREVGSPQGDVVRTVLVPQLIEVLRDGATLIVDGIDRMHPPLDGLARRLERTLRERVQMNAYGTWGESKGFDSHWDDHDVIVLHIAGRKEWTLFGPPRRVFPLEQDVEENPPPAADAERRALVLTPGDVLHIPRGWWHTVRAVEGPTLHLTVAVPRATGVDLAHWLADRLCEHEVFRADLPRHLGAREREDHRRELAATLAAVLDDAELMDRFFAERDACAAPRRRHSLAAVEGGGERVGDERTVTWLAPRALLRAEGDRTVLLADGRRWTFAGAAQGMLAHLLDALDAPVGAVVAAARDGGVGDAEARCLLVELIEAGLVAVGEEQRGFL
ncbi:cupin domain-containing protein [Streptomyces varsoviensis]|uniref:cupin domain-containing protein n=1 Tax=Streptomyces varsoviensis TaxID=67373 RepID=UPI0033C6F813